MSINVAVDTAQTTIRLQSITPKTRAVVKTVVTADTVKLWNTVRVKLSDDVLHVRTGNLRRSIQQDVETTDDGSTGRVFSDASVKYARIHEYGGKVEIPEISGKLMVFQFEGKTVFTRHTKAHSVTIPERPYMRPSLQEIAPQFIAHMRAAVAGAGA